ncbi:hypothetical protein ACKKBG_A28315 [Auxenochlorella protothecoides x Auxenochlorella symbiontica]
MSSGLLRSMKLKLAGGTPKSGKPDSGAGVGVSGTAPGPVGASTAPPPPGQAPRHAVGPVASTSGRGGVPETDPGHGFPALTEEEMQRRYAEPLPSFRDVSPGERQALFVAKLHLCSFTFDFSDPASHVHEKEVKRATLLELVDHVNSGSGKFKDALAPDIVGMLAANLFRALPPAREHGPDAFDVEEEEPNLEPAWPHLQIVYEFLLRYVVSGDTDAKTAKRYIDQQFVVRLLDLFDSEDPRERDYLKTILHRVYGKFMVHRPFIRKAINFVFYRFVFETERHNGIAELLEILGSIINGFALPLKEEHKGFLTRALMPLHKPKSLPQYHQQLSYCITQFVEKDSRLAVPVIQGLLKFWPITNSHKEVLFLGELEEVLEWTQAPEFAEVMEPLFRRIARCLTSSHFQVAERSLFLWNNDVIVSQVAQHKEVVLPLVLAALEDNAAHHWNSTVHSLTLNVRKMFQEMDRSLYDSCLRKLAARGDAEAAAATRRQAQWLAIERAALPNGVPHRDRG